MNILEPEDIQWKHVKHLTLSKQSHIVARDNRYNIQHEQLCNRDGHGKVGKTKNYYFIDSVSKEFTNVQEMCDAWNEINNFDDPNKEIHWVKVIRNKQIEQNNKEN